MRCLLSAANRALRPSAPGADGWNVRELQALSPVAIDLLTEIYNAIETLEKWPTVLCEVPIATLRKGEGCSPLDVRPISLTPILYRVWARTRFLQLQAWRMQWLPVQLKGGVPGKESIDAYLEVALDAEFCVSSNRPLFGIFYDYCKCFDNVAWPIERGLLRDLGMPQNVLGHMYAWAANVQRRFKLGSSLGPKFANTNSISQGCPLAILRINALISAWVYSIQSRESLSSCSLGGYVDDRNMRSTDVQELQEAVHLTEKFDHCVDGVVNFKKCATYATTALARKQVSSVTLDGKPLKVVSDDRLLGGHHCFSKRRARWLANQRATKYLEVARRISICPLSINARYTLLATAGAAKFLFGIELGACTRKLEAQVRKAVVNAVWSKRSCKSNDMVLTLCFRGHKADPTQIRLIQPFITIRRQLRKHPSMCQLWTHIWLNTQKQRDKFKDFRSNAVGPAAVLSQICRENLIGIGLNPWCSKCQLVTRVISFFIFCSILMSTFFISYVGP